MVLTNYECWANSVGDNNVCDITLQQALLRPQIDLFNPRTLSACGIAQKEQCSQQSGSREISANVSQISSNGYYGFTYVNNNDDVAGNGNDVNTNFGNHEAKRQHHIFDANLNRTKKLEFDNTSAPQLKKRALLGEDFTNNQTIAKRCRLETLQEGLNSFPLMDSASHMDIDDVAFHKEAKTPNVFLAPPSTSNVKSLDKSVSLNSAMNDAKFYLNECNKNLIENKRMSRTIYMQELKDSTMYDAQNIYQNISCYEKIKKSENNEMFLEQMFSQTHGSGAYCLENMDFDEHLYDRNDI